MGVDRAGGSLGSPCFDAYNATVLANNNKVLDFLEQALMDAGFKTKREKGPSVRFYAENDLLLDEFGQRILSMRSGGANGWPFIECKGPASDVVAAVLREHWPEQHWPSRIDSAYDLRGENVFAQLAKIAHETEQRGIRLDYAGAATDHPSRGTTIYLGSRKSQVFIRIYQKGLKHAEEIGLSPDAIPDDLRNWVRVEVELKPQKKAAKAVARSLTAEGIFGSSPWVQRFATEALSIDAERVHMRERRETNHDRAMRHMIHQYRSHLIEEARRCGSWSELGRYIGEAVLELHSADESQ